MMIKFYADENGLYQAPNGAAIEITQAQHDEAFNHLLSGGLLKIVSGNLVLTRNPENRAGFEEPVWNGEEWHFEPLPKPETPTPDPLDLRAAAYRVESDPLKIEAEYDALLAGTEPDYTAWLAKVAEIKARFPK